MSRRLLAFLLAELKIIRFKCAKCAAVTELEIEKVSPRLEESPNCPLCGIKWMVPQENHIGNLAKAIKGIQGRSDAVSVEFVLPDNGD